MIYSNIHTPNESISYHSTGKVSKDECVVLNAAIDDKYLPTGCVSLMRASTDDAFATPQKTAQDAFQGKDKDVHRNSWLWPKMARRLTKDSPVHVSNWRKPVEVDDKQCAIMLEALEAKFGGDAVTKLPQACKV